MKKRQISQTAPNQDDQTSASVTQHELIRSFDQRKAVSADRLVRNREILPKILPAGDDVDDTKVKRRKIADQ